MASVDEVWIVDVGDPVPAEPARRRPAIVLGPVPAFGVDFPITIVCPLTTTQRGLALHVEVEPTPSNGLDQVSYIQCELIRSVGTRRLVRRLGVVDNATSRHVHDIVRMLLGL